MIRFMISASIYCIIFFDQEKKINFELLQIKCVRVMFSVMPAVELNESLFVCITVKGKINR